MPRIRPAHVVGLVGLLIAAAIIIPWLGTTTDCGARTRDAANIRQVAQASLIYAYDHNGRLPEAEDVWDYARHLAQSGLSLPEFWSSKLDPARETELPGRITLDQSPHRQIDPTFRQMKLSVAVPLGKLNTALPATTPIAWTRGLKPDGTWAKHSPYGGEGGYIAFLDSSVKFFKNLSTDGGQLTRFDGKGKTANILEALPPGTRIGEYVPTPAEQEQWSIANDQNAPLHPHRDPFRAFLIGGILVIWCGFSAVSFHRYRKGTPGVIRIFIWPVIITILLLILTPSIG